MDYSQILAAQLTNKDPWFTDEDAFYSEFGFEGLARIGNAFVKLKDTLMSAALLRRQDDQKPAEIS